MLAAPPPLRPSRLSPPPPRFPPPRSASPPSRSRSLSLSLFGRAAPKKSGSTGPRGATSEAPVRPPCGAPHTRRRAPDVWRTLAPDAAPSSFRERPTRPLPTRSCTSFSTGAAAPTSAAPRALPTVGCASTMASVRAVPRKPPRDARGRSRAWCAAFGPAARPCSLSLRGGACTAACAPRTRFLAAARRWHTSWRRSGGPLARRRRATCRFA